MYYINDNITSITTLLSQKPRQCGNCGSNLLDARAPRASPVGALDSNGFFLFSNSANLTNAIAYRRVSSTSQWPITDSRCPYQ